MNHIDFAFLFNIAAYKYNGKLHELLSLLIISPINGNLSVLVKQTDSSTGKTNTKHGDSWIRI